MPDGEADACSNDDKYMHGTNKTNNPISFDKQYDKQNKTVIFSIKVLALTISLPLFTTCPSHRDTSEFDQNFLKMIRFL